MKRLKSDEFEPIPTEQLEEWNALIEEGKAVVKDQDNATWKLILIVGKVTNSFGRGKIKRYADEINIGAKSVYEYSWLYRSGVNEEFVEKWGGTLSYSMIREILKHTGRVDAPATQFFLEYASTRRISVRAMISYMLGTIAENDNRGKVGEEMKLALMHKQEAEGFSDYIKAQLEEIVEANPDLASTVMKHSIITTEDLEQLKISAGIATDEEITMAAKAKRIADRIKRYQKQIKSESSALKEHLAYGHENSDELRLQLQKLLDTVGEVLETEVRKIEIVDAESVPVTAFAKSNGAWAVNEDGEPL